MHVHVMEYFVPKQTANILLRKKILFTLAWIVACAVSNSFVLSSIIPKYRNILSSVTPSWLCNKWSIWRRSQPIFLNNESIPKKRNFRLEDRIK